MPVEVSDGRDRRKGSGDAGSDACEDMGVRGARPVGEIGYVEKASVRG